MPVAFLHNDLTLPWRGVVLRCSCFRTERLHRNILVPRDGLGCIALNLGRCIKLGLRRKLVLARVCAPWSGAEQRALAGDVRDVATPA